MIYNSFICYFSHLYSTEDHTTVLNEYVNSNRRRELNDISGYDWVRKLYVNYEGQKNPIIIMIILAVYGEKCGIVDARYDRRKGKFEDRLWRYA